MSKTLQNNEKELTLNRINFGKKFNCQKHFFKNTFIYKTLIDLAYEYLVNSLLKLIYIFCPSFP